MKDSSFLIVYIRRRTNDEGKCCWTGDFIIESGKGNVLLYDADYSVQAAMWKPFSAVSGSRIVFLPKADNGNIISYKLVCRCSKKYTPYIEVSSNCGNLAPNSRKKVRIFADDCAICNVIPKVVFGEREEEQIMKTMSPSFPPPCALPKTLENYMKGIGYKEVISGGECKSLEESFMKQLISMLIPLILQLTPPNLLKSNDEGVKILWKSKKHRLALMHQYIETFKQKAIDNYTFQKLK
uniref:Uncharacterized protein n=1 Tax=Setaria digitata TaxID=48799 RepID=A0A915Q6P1_9BILA